MALIKFGDNGFGGMIPKIDKRSLPNEAAQSANNCDLYNGKLAPINVTPPFQVLHDPDTGAMKNNIPDGEIIKITKLPVNSFAIYPQLLFF